RRSADGRWPVDNGTHAFDVGVHQVTAANTSSGPPVSRHPTTPEHILDVEDLAVLTAWAEGVAEVLAYAPDRAVRLLAEARPGAPWRTTLGLPEPSPRLSAAIDSLTREVRAATPEAGPKALEALLTAASEDRPGEQELDGLARRVLRAMLEQRHTRRRPTSEHIRRPGESPLTGG